MGEGPKTPLLDLPGEDPERDALDAGLMAALAARAALPTAAGDAEAIRRRDLLAQAPDAVTARLMRLVWGRLDVAQGSTVQGPAAVTCGAEAALLAADRLGAGFRPLAEPEAALAAAAGGAPALIDVAGRPWWGRLLARPELRVVQALPDDAMARPRALMVSRQPGGPTGEDRSFWVTDSGLADARITQALGAVGLLAEPLAAAGGLKLFMLAGYVQAEDGRLMGAPGDLTGVIGAAPVF